jgi:putative transposase
MPEYRRWFEPGATYFFTVVTHDRRPFLLEPEVRTELRTAILRTQSERPFRMFSSVLLPDHFHCVWVLPDDDEDYSVRWRLIKARVSVNVRKTGLVDTNRSPSQRRRGERAVWQRRFWGHRVRNEGELERICGYIHYNPVRHGLVACPHGWPHSSFHRFVHEGYYDVGWNCSCTRAGKTPDFSGIERIVGE